MRGSMRPLMNASISASIRSRISSNSSSKLPKRSSQEVRRLLLLSYAMLFTSRTRSPRRPSGTCPGRYG
jgi:hypothetical protein